MPKFKDDVQLDAGRVPRPHGRERHGSSLRLPRSSGRGLLGHGQSGPRSGGRQLDAGIILSGAVGGSGGGIGGSGAMVRNPTPVRRMLNIQER